MHCVTSCYLAMVFLFSMLYMTLMVDKSKTLVNVLSKEQLELYKKIVVERRNHMIVGYLLGLSLSTIVIMTTKEKYLQVCYAIIITYLVSYFYYTLMPKTDYMLIHLETEEKRRAWLNVYLRMKNNYHLSFVLGIIFVAFASHSI